MNQKELSLGLDSIDYGYWTKLLNVLQPKAQPSSTLLGKRLIKLDDRLHSSYPPANLSYKAEFASEMISYSKSNSGQQPHIMKMTLNDYYLNITVVSSCPLFKLFLIGTSRGIVKAIFVNKSEEIQKADDELAQEEQKEKQALENKDATQGAEKQGEVEKVAEEFESTLNMFEFVGHTSAVVSVSLRYDSKRFVSGSIKGEIRLWDIPLRVCLYSVHDHFKCVLSLKMSPKGDLFASAGSEQIIYLWSEHSTKRLMSFSGHLNDINQLEFTQNMNYLVSTALDCTMRVWQLSTGECTRVVRLQSHLTTFSLNLNGDIAICGSESGQVCFIDISKVSNHMFFRCQTQATPGHENRIRKISIQPDERMISVAKKDQISLISMEELYKVYKEVQDCEKREDSDTVINTIWQRDYRTMCSSLFESDKLDIISSQFTLEGVLIVFNRSSVLI